MSPYQLDLLNLIATRITFLERFVNEEALNTGGY